MLIQGIIRTAYQLTRKETLGYYVLPLPTVIDAGFADQVMEIQENEAAPKILSSNQLVGQFLSIAPLARQRCLLRVMNRIVAECSQQSDFFLTCTEIFRHYSSDSNLLSVMERVLDAQDDLLLHLLQDAAEMTSEIDDWRLVRLWILLFEWVLSRLSAESMQVRQSSSAGLEQERISVSVISDAAFWDMVYKAQSVHRQGAQASTAISYIQAINQLLDAQRTYIFLSAAPEQLSLRRRLAFLIGAAAAQRNGTLVWILRDHFQVLEQAVDCSVESMDLLPHRVQSVDAVASFLAHLSLAYDSEQEFGAIGEHFAALLKELQTLNKMYVQNEVSKLALETMLGRIIQTYLPLLRLSSVFLADVVCATVVYINCNDTGLWKSVIQIFLSTTSESSQDRVPNLFMTPLIARLQDIGSTIGLEELRTAFDTLKH
ncbi:hypothetical protein BG011_003912 [Mortierella polycephala]|uniref:Uncharacterized protein n=1 Tax=Mortierella polycephala TaxID=41804 RepID=A0A9P6U340_9FUNG|nr:hypothetical protein BG011_003912 [Mortierella polycephala]